MRTWLIGLGILLALAAASAGGGYFWLKAQLTAPGPSLAATTVVIHKGERSEAIAAQLQDARVIATPWVFLAEVKLTGPAPLKAGEYAFPAQASLATILDMMRKGEVVVHRFTLPEGLTVRQAMRDLRMAEALTGAVDATPAEGSLLPQTYFYTFGEGRQALVTRMTKARDELLDALWAKRRPDLPLAGKAEAVVLASIIERETALPEERPHIAAVFYNRMKLGMKLQSDPTTIYALSQGEGVLDHPLTKADLMVEDPYNTYVVAGLPPGAICNPGRASLEAVFNPAASDDLYFVADGTGGHAFSKTLAEHNSARNRNKASQGR